MIITSVWGSVRFRSLPDDSCKLAYLFLHTNTHGNSIGAYRMPVEYLMADMQKEKDEAKRIVDAIAEAGLIQYDHDESALRILNWFPHNPINSPKHLAGAVSRFLDIPKKATFLPDVAVEIIMSAHAKARELGLRGRSQVAAAKTERAKTSGIINIESSATMIQALSEMVEGLTQGQQTKVIAGINQHPRRLVQHIAEDLSLPVSGIEYRGSDTPTDTPTDTPLGTETDTQTQTDTQTDTETETQIRPDIQAEIDGLKARAEAQR